MAPKDKPIGERTILRDVSGDLPRSSEKRYRERSACDIRVCFIHHSGAYGRDGYEGLLASTRYVVESRGWPGAPYTYWVPSRPDTAVDGRLIVYRCQPDTAWSYHTRGANGIGVAIALQGNLRDKPPTSAQWAALTDLTVEVKRAHPGIAFCPHSESDRWGGIPKPMCPGPFLEAFVMGLAVSSRK